MPPEFRVVLPEDVLRNIFDRLNSAELRVVAQCSKFLEEEAEQRLFASIHVVRSYPRSLQALLAVFRSPRRHHLVRYLRFQDSRMSRYHEEHIFPGAFRRAITRSLQRLTSLKKLELSYVFNPRIITKPLLFSFTPTIKRMLSRRISDDSQSLWPVASTLESVSFIDAVAPAVLDCAIFLRHTECLRSLTITGIYEDMGLLGGVDIIELKHLRDLELEGEPFSEILEAPNLQKLTLYLNMVLVRKSAASDATIALEAISRMASRFPSVAQLQMHAFAGHEIPLNPANFSRNAQSHFFLLSNIYRSTWLAADWPLFVSRLPPVAEFEMHISKPDNQEEEEDIGILASHACRAARVETPTKFSFIYADRQHTKSLRN